MPLLLLGVPIAVGLGAVGVGYAAEKTEDLTKTLVVGTLLFGIGYLIYKRKF